MENFFGSVRDVPVKVRNAPIWDRAKKFLGIEERVNKPLASQNWPSDLSPSEAMQSESNRQASEVGFRFHQTSRKLAWLAILVKRASAFDDPIMEIQDLTTVLKHDITELNYAVVDLQVYCISPKGIGSISSDTTTYSTAVVDNLKNQLLSATKEFDEVLAMLMENLKVHENRRKWVSFTASSNPLNFLLLRRSAAKSAESSSAAPPLLWANGAQSSSQVFSKNQVDGKSLPLLQKQLVSPQDNYVQSRVGALQNVELTICKLSNIFNDLATMVSQQGEIAVRNQGGGDSQPVLQQQQWLVSQQDKYMQCRAGALQPMESTVHGLSRMLILLFTSIAEDIRDGDNTGNTMSNVEGAQGPLMKYYNSIPSSWRLMIEIFFEMLLIEVFCLFFLA